eukprot:1167849-Amphidinium_carterae.1
MGHSQSHATADLGESSLGALCSAGLSVRLWRAGGMHSLRIAAQSCPVIAQRCMFIVADWIAEAADSQQRGAPPER